MPAPEPFKMEVSRYEDGGPTVEIDVKLSPKTDINWMVKHAGGIYHFSTKEVLKSNIFKIVYPHG